MGFEHIDEMDRVSRGCAKGSERVAFGRCLDGASSCRSIKERMRKSDMSYQTHPCPVPIDPKRDGRDG